MTDERPVRRAAAGPDGASARFRAFACYLRGRAPDDPQARRYTDALVRRRLHDVDPGAGGKANRLWSLWATIAAAAAIGNLAFNRPGDSLLWALVTLGWLLTPARRALTRNRLRGLASDHQPQPDRQRRE